MNIRGMLGNRRIRQNCPNRCGYTLYISRGAGELLAARFFKVSAMQFSASCKKALLHGVKCQFPEKSE